MANIIDISGINVSGTPPRVWTDYGNTLTDDSPEIIAAKELATVWIMNNYGDLGGGIGNNGIIQVGGETEGDKISISITKQWSGIIHSTPDSITVRLYQDGQPYVAGPYVDGYITIYKTVNSENQEIWPTYYVDGLPSGHTYTIVEVPVVGYTAEVTVTPDGNSFTVTNTSVDFGVLKKWIGDQGVGRPTSISVQLYQNDLLMEIRCNFRKQTTGSMDGRIFPKWTVTMFLTYMRLTKSTSPTVITFRVKESIRKMEFGKSQIQRWK